LESTGSLAAEERPALANAVERWRYHLLQRGFERLGATEQRLVEALDHLSAALRNERSHGAFQTRQSIANRQRRETFEWALDPATEIEDVAERARRVTRRCFSTHRPSAGEPDRRWRMQLYAPLYLSSYCINHCHYCHFRYPNDLRREHLSVDAALAQADFLASRGFRRLLLVAGDFPKLTSTAYFAEMTAALVARGFHIKVEIAPRSTQEYQQLAAAGVRGVTLYQETYQEDAYQHYHERGTKHWFDWRLEGLKRAAQAGIAQLGLGILLGLAPPKADLYALAQHADYLAARFPEAEIAFSLPRLHDAPQPFVPPYRVDNEMFVRFYSALRLSFPRAELVLSTRERPQLRDRLANICITQMSAESCTVPGGYGAQDPEAAGRGQFPVQDSRTAAEMAEWLRQSGFDVSFEDDHVRI
jgi:2-iminoacetate synthase